VNPETTGNWNRAGDGELLDQVRATALRLLSDIPSPPSSLRVQVGEIGVHVEWAVPVPVAAAPGVPAPADPREAEGTDDAALATHHVIAPTVGVFYRAPSPGAAPFVEEGDTVAAGTQVGIVEAMKLMVPVEADRAGRVSKVLKSDGDPVEYGEPLIRLAPVGAG